MIRRAAVFKLAEESTMQGLFSSQLQSDRRQVIGGGSQDLPPYRTAAGKKDFVKRQRSKGCGGFRPPPGRPKRTREKKVPPAARRITRAVLPASSEGLDYCTVPGCQRADQRRKAELKRIIPWGQDQYRPVGDRCNPAVCPANGSRGSQPALLRAQLLRCRRA